METNNKYNKYLRVTIHDNDFSFSLELIGNLLYEIFYFEDNYPTEEHLPMLKEHIKHLWYRTYRIQDLMRNLSSAVLDDAGYFNPHLEIVDAADIPEWDNGESIYIPMFEDAKVLSR